MTDDALIERAMVKHALLSDASTRAAMHWLIEQVRATYRHVGKADCHMSAEFDVVIDSDIFIHAPSNKESAPIGTALGADETPAPTPDASNPIPSWPLLDGLPPPPNKLSNQGLTPPQARKDGWRVDA